jgi:phage terminase large subunit
MTAVPSPANVRAVQADLSLFAEHALGLHLTRDQRKILRIMSKPGAWLSIRTSHGIGKSYAAAALVCSFLVTHPGSKVISTAPTNRQVRDILWMEVNQMFRNAKIHLGGECKTMRWDMRAGWFAIGIATREPEQIQGRHGDHILFVLDEAAGIAPKIWLAVRTMTTGLDARCLAIGNPTRVTGDFAATFKDSRWQNLRISYREAPNITGEMHIPGGCTAAWVEDMARKFGRDSAIFKSRCEAEFPDDDVTSIIPWSRVAAAMEPGRQEAALAVPPGQDLHMGVDVARFGRAYSVLTVRDGPRSGTTGRRPRRPPAG